MRPPVLRDDVDLKGALIKTDNLLTIDNFPNSRFLIEFLPGISSKGSPSDSIPSSASFQDPKFREGAEIYFILKIEFLKS